MYDENINAYEILKLASNKKNEVTLTQTKSWIQQGREFLNTLRLSAF